MIVVLADLGGERLLGKAREIADARGYRVLAICSDESNAERSIALGADEVEVYPVSTLEDWIEVISETVKAEQRIKILLLPSTIAGDVILGAVYARNPEMFGLVMDNVESLSDVEAVKSLPSASSILESKLSEDKISLLSLKLASVPEPFLDSRRFGKTKIRPKKEKISSEKSERGLGLKTSSGPEYLYSSTELSILVGRNIARADNYFTLVSRLADKFDAKIIAEDRSPPVIYGPCVALEVSSPLRELPRFYGDLISVNSITAPISKISNLAVIERDPAALVEQLLSI